MLPDVRADDRDITRARLQGRRAANGFVIVVAVLFIAASAVQIVHAVFANTIPPSVESEPCVFGIKRLAFALEHGCATDPADWGTGEPRATRHESAAGAAISPELAPCKEQGAWAQADGVALLCARTSDGLDAWAALERMRLAQEELARHARTDIEPLEHDVAAHLPADLR